MKTSAAYRRLVPATDPAEMQERIATLMPEIGFTAGNAPSLTVPRVMPRKSGEVLIQYRTSAPSDGSQPSVPILLYGEFFPEQIPLPSTRAERGRRVIAIEELRLRIWRFPSDPELLHLPVLFDGPRFTKTYGESLEIHSLPATQPEQGVESLGYRLGRRFVGRVRWNEAAANYPNGTKEVIVKMCRPKQALALWTRQRQLENVGFHSKAEDSISLPQQHFVHGETGAIFQAFEPGRSLHNLIGDKRFVAGCEAAARVLEKLQRVKITGLPRYSSNVEIDHLNWLCATTADAFPASGASIRRFLRELLCAVPGGPPGSEMTVCHRDFYDKQILFDGTRSTLIDYDTLSEGDASHDYGNFMAHLHWRAMQEPGAAELIDAGIDAFDRHRLVINPAAQGRVGWWTAATRLRIACLYLWRPRWTELAGAFLTDSLSRLTVTA